MRPLAVVLLAGALAAQDLPTAADVTEPGRTIAHALDQVLRGSADAGEQRTLIVLIDSTQGLQAAGFEAKWSQALTRQSAHLQSCKIGVAQVGHAGAIVLKPTTDLAAVTRAVATTVAKPSDQFQNVFADVRAAAAAFSGAGARELLLVTLDNGDLEDDLEATVRELKRHRVKLSVLTSEAYLADSYWAARPYQRKPRRTELASGGDAPFVDLPWGWLFQVQNANEVAPSGFGRYGLNRIAAVSGGRVYLYAPAQSTTHSCGIRAACLFCPGDHIAPVETFTPGRVNLLAPSTLARKELYSRIAGDPYFRAVQKAWRAATNAGLLRSRPPVKLVGTSAQPERNRPGRPVLLFDTAQFSRKAARADKAARVCDQILKRLDADITSAGESRFPRQRAMAELTRFQLQVTKVNLITFASWCRDVAPTWAEPGPDELGPPEVRAIDERRVRGIGFTNMSLCHGAARFLSVDLPGGERLHQELLKLDSMQRQFLERYGNTAWAHAVDRSCIARFHFPSPGAVVSRPRPRPASQSKPDPLTPTPRPKRGGASSGTVGGPTTGGRR